MTELQIAMSLTEESTQLKEQIAKTAPIDLLKTLGRATQELEAISPQLPDATLSFTEKLSLTFEVLSDVGNKVCRSYGLVFTLPEEIRPIYEKFGFDFQAAMVIIPLSCQYLPLMW